MSQRFSKSERLKSRKTIGRIFKEGKPIKAYPLLAVYLREENSTDVRVGFSVSRKKFKKAVDRNHIKRWMLEAYRLQRDSLLDAETQGVALMIMYVAAKEESFEKVKKSMARILNSLNDENSSVAVQSEEN